MGSVIEILHMREETASLRETYSRRGVSDAALPRDHSIKLL